LILQLEKIGIECDPCPLEEIDHTVIKPNIVYYCGLITETVVPLDTYSLGEDFMKDIITDIYGMVKCARSELTVSLVVLPQLPKSMSSHSVYWQYTPYCMLGYPCKAATQDQSAVS
jgi:poly(A) polymerase